MPDLESDALRRKPVEPGPEQRRRFHRARKNPAAGADERLLPEFLAPSANRVWRHCFDNGRKHAFARTISPQERCKILAVREIEPAPPGHKELAPKRWHPLIDRNADAGFAARQHFRSHQPGRSATYDGDVEFGIICHGSPNTQVVVAGSRITDGARDRVPYHQRAANDRATGLQQACPICRHSD